MTILLGRSRLPIRNEVKSGLRDMWGSLEDRSHGDDDLSDLLARLDEAVRISDVVEGKGACDRRPECPRCQTLVHELLHRCKLMVVARERWQRDAPNGQV